MLAFSHATTHVWRCPEASLQASNHVNRVNIPLLALRDSRATESGKTTERWWRKVTGLKSRRTPGRRDCPDSAVDRVVLEGLVSEQGQLATDHGAVEIYRAGFT